MYLRELYLLVSLLSLTLCRHVAPCGSVWYLCFHTFMSYTCLPIGSHTFWLLYCVPLSTTLPTLNIRRESRLEGKWGTDLFRLISADQGHRVPRGKSSFSHQMSPISKSSSLHHSSRDSWIYTFSRVPRIPNINYLQLAKITPLLEDETVIVTGCGQSEAAPYFLAGIKTKTST